MINQQNVTIKNGSSWDKICPFPVGFIYLSQNSTSPATTFGGTWAALNEDRFLRPSNAWTTGGSKKISTSQMPSHTHKITDTPWITSDWKSTNIPTTNSQVTPYWYVTNAAWNLPSVGGGRMTGRNTEIAMVGIGLHSPHQIGIGLHNLCLLDGGEC